MPRPRSARIQEIKDALRRSLVDGFRLPGARFLSARALARKHGVSYVTAHRLLAELADEGLIARRAAAGTFLEGESPSLTRVQLFFNPRARRPDSFGARLLAGLTAELRRQGIPFSRAWRGAPRSDAYPVVWERPELLASFAQRHRFALALNESPPPGSAAYYIDSVTSDEFSGGAWAAQWLRRLVGANGKLAVLAGPSSDPRSCSRRDGFLSIEPRAEVVAGGTWFYEDALPAARRALGTRAGGIFCCNDRLAHAVFDAAAPGRRPRIVGFDNAPVAEKLGLSTIGLPWTEFVATAVDIIARRLAGSSVPARRVILPHEPVSRGTT